jgi:hypothetical protein
MPELQLLFTTTGRMLLLAWRSLWPSTNQGAGPSLRRVLVMAGFIPVFTLLQLIHWVGLLLDEILFRGYHRVEIREPVFVLGVPRSGTTHLHRVLARDPQYTTFSTWECLFAPSVTERRILMGVGWLDTRLGRPLHRLLGALERRAFGRLDQVHAMGLGDPEEDYFALMPVLACFILVLPFPTDPYLWRMGTFDRDMPDDERARIMAFYRRCLQRHLYVHGPEKRLLSKNAAFAPLAGSLREAFPDARFIVCLRAPTETLPSQLSSLESGIRFFGVLDVVPDFHERLARQLGFYYENLERALDDLPEDRCTWVTMSALKVDLVMTLETVYARLGLLLEGPFRACLTEEAALSRGYRSGHRYTLAQYRIGPESLGRGLMQVYGRLAKRAMDLEPKGASGSAADRRSASEVLS